MHYSEFYTENLFKDYIQKFWVLSNLNNPCYTLPKYALPNGCCTLAFISGNGISLTFGHRAIELPPGIYLAGQPTRRVAIALKPNSQAVMVQVKPWLPALLTHFPMNRLVDDVLSLEHLNANLYRKLAGVNDAGPERIALTVHKNLAAYLNPDADAQLIRWAFHKLQENTLVQQNRISNVMAASGYSERRMEQKFKALVGPSAKEIQRILQLRNLINDLDAEYPDDHLSTLAHRHGYYDQSHFIKSYQQILSEKPSLFEAEHYILPTSGHFGFLQL